MFIMVKKIIIMIAEHVCAPLLIITIPKYLIYYYCNIYINNTVHLLTCSANLFSHFSRDFFSRFNLDCVDLLH